MGEGDAGDLLPPSRPGRVQGPPRRQPRYAGRLVRSQRARPSPHGEGDGLQHDGVLGRRGQPGIRRACRPRPLDRSPARLCRSLRDPRDAADRPAKAPRVGRHRPTPGLSGPLLRPPREAAEAGAQRGGGRATDRGLGSPRVSAFSAQRACQHRSQVRAGSRIGWRAARGGTGHDWRAADESRPRGTAHGFRELRRPAPCDAARDGGQPCRRREARRLLRARAPVRVFSRGGPGAEPHPDRGLSQRGADVSRQRRNVAPLLADPAQDPWPRGPQAIRHTRPAQLDRPGGALRAGGGVDRRGRSSPRRRLRRRDAQRGV